MLPAMCNFSSSLSPPSTLRIRASSLSNASAPAEEFGKTTMKPEALRIPRKAPQQQHQRPRTPASPFTSLFITPPPLPVLLPAPTLNSPRSSTDRALRYTPLLLLVTLFVLSLLPIIASLSSLPIGGPRALPRTLADISSLAKQLQGYADSSLQGKVHVMAVLSLTAIWKHAWSVPGSVILNVLVGTMMSPIQATLLQTLLTTIGSLLATLLATPLSSILSVFFPRALTLTRHALNGDSPNSSDNLKPTTPTWVRLVIMRLVGIVPWSGINIACGVVGVRLWECAVGAFIGTLPWTAVTCQIGDILQTLASGSSPSAGPNPQTLSSILSSPSVILKLVFLSALSMGPVLMRDSLRSILSRSSESHATPEETEKLVHDGSESDEQTQSQRRWSWRRFRTSHCKESTGSSTTLAEEEVALSDAMDEKDDYDYSRSRRASSSSNTSISA